MNATGLIQLAPFGFCTAWPNRTHQAISRATSMGRPIQKNIEIGISLGSVWDGGCKPSIVSFCPVPVFEGFPPSTTSRGGSLDMALHREANENIQPTNWRTSENQPGVNADGFALAGRMIGTLPVKEVQKSLARLTSLY